MKKAVFYAVLSIGVLAALGEASGLQLLPVSIYALLGWMNIYDHNKKVSPWIIGLAIGMTFVNLVDPISWIDVVMWIMVVLAHSKDK